MNFNYRESLQEKSDKYLLEMVLIRYEEYEAPALKIAEEILLERNVNIQEFENDLEFMGKGIKKQSIERSEEKNKAQVTIGFLLIAGGIGLNILSYFAFGMRVGFIGMVAILYGLFMIIKFYVQKRQK